VFIVESSIYAEVHNMASLSAGGLLAKPRMRVALGLSGTARFCIGGGHDDVDVRPYFQRLLGGRLDIALVVK